MKPRHNPLADSITPYIYPGLYFNSKEGKINNLNISDYEAIIRHVSDFFRIPVEQVKSDCRKKEIMVPRQISMHILYKHTAATLKKIGYMFGRDHSSAIHSRDTVEDLIDTDKRYHKKYRECFAYVVSKIPEMQHTYKNK